MKKIVILLTGAIFASCATTKLVESVAVEKTDVTITVNDLERPVKAVFISDCHITLEDERGADYYKYSKRMGRDAVEPEHYNRSNGREKNLLATLEIARQQGAELVILGGDIINFPSEASVELVLKIMQESGLNWVYTSGNHDWHYEGMEGSLDELRAEWTERRLKPLYQGKNSMFVSEVIGGINFITIDNSTNEISGEQLEFFKEQDKLGLPIVLAMHIPLYVPHTSTSYGCGHPNWNAKNDPLYKLERRERWPEEGHTDVTYEFRDMVFASKNIVCVVAGHTHSFRTNFYNGVAQIVSSANFLDSYLMMEFTPSEP